MPRIDADRLWARLMALAEIGATPAGGVNRQALSAGEIEAWRLLIGWAEAAGMQASTDPAGNLFLVLPGRDRGLPPLMMGSHIDTQPTGGKFDGAFGVLAALEAAESLDATPERDVVVVAWMNEEGSRFAPGMMGSEAFAGVRALEEVLAARDAAGTTVAEALATLQAAFPHLPCRPLGFPIGFYLEPHIEQGPLLEQRGTPIGIVTGIQGKKTYEIAVEGAEGHAGTLDMADRRDALAAFARMANAMFREVGAADPAVKFTIGMARVEPNAPSVVPSRVTFRIDLRHPENAALDAFGTRLEALAEAHAPPCTVQVKVLVDAPSNEFDPDLRARIAAGAEALGHPAMPILSAAGHDARHMAPLCPSAMIFIPCRGGVSHAEHEWAEPAHVAAGAAVLAEVAASLVLEEETAA
ncbi:N-carbamoyl-L-amino-acid hydrolase [Roseomonas rosea]|uniref:N-carbamoyl-L-amino-acid hydrolase n=2 Tax=Muricoccus roseus TaxID=198092 RepID=A0A1M6AM04_9PROT|nr:N-carbamoyl-L-amino-acid hydrolase [Roseomonas rosea]